MPRKAPPFGTLLVAALLAAALWPLPAPAAAPATLAEALATLKAPATGPADAPVTVYEIGNYTCPFCKDAHPVLQRIIKEYAGKIRFVYFPYIRQYDEDSRNSAVAAFAAWEQGKFWEMHDALFTSAPDLSVEKILALAAGLKLDKAKIESAVREKKRLDELNKGLDLIHSFDVWSTPTVVVGDKVLKGSQPYEAYKAAIDAALSARKGGLLGAARSLLARLGSFLLPEALAGEGGKTCQVTPGMFGPVGAPLFVKVPPARPLNALAVGDPAPAFSLPCTDGEMVNLADYKGKKNVLLFFLPAAFTPV